MDIYYYSLSEPPLLTMITGAKCTDGIVLVADRKFTDYSSGSPQFCQKIFGDIEHILIGYTGWERTFDIFRKYMVNGNACGVLKCWKESPLWI
jgi:20S proteasome alpha/beta subunit